MELLPLSAAEFRDPKYWRRFFEKRAKPFEWYGDYNLLKDSLKSYLSPKDKILEIGCGNSQLASELYDDSYRNITSIDSDEKVIEQQRETNKESRPDLIFKFCSATKIDLDDESVSVVLDKGTLDALLPEESDETKNDTAKLMLSEVDRVLKLLGRYIIVSLAQSHVFSFFCEFFLTKNQYSIRVQSVEGEEFSMPIFLLIVTKFRIQPTEPLLEFVQFNESKKEIKRTPDLKTLEALIRAKQEFSWFKSKCSRKLEQEISIDAYDASGIERYRITVVDDQDSRDLSTYAIFVVPIGREYDWIFATEKGRALLCKKCNKSRLAIVFLIREQKYDSLEVIKDELRSFVMQIAPHDLKKAISPLIEYLSLGETDVKKTIAKGKSVINGNWVIEDVAILKEHYRRLIFLNSSGIIQSEALITKSKKKRNWSIDFNSLASEHHRVMMTSFLFLPERMFNKSNSADMKILVLGLGGGVLPSYIRQRLPQPQAEVNVVELDPDIVEIAKQWFSLKTNDPKLSVTVQDALEFIALKYESAENRNRYDVILMDIAGDKNVEGLTGPPPVFVQMDTLNQMAKILKPEGVIAFNLITRDEKIANEVVNRIKCIFPCVYSHTSLENVNQVLICLKKEISFLDAQRIYKLFFGSNKLNHYLIENLNELKSLNDSSKN